mgnify:CR=1 FL=1
MFYEHYKIVTDSWLKFDQNKKGYIVCLPILGTQAIHDIHNDMNSLGTGG